MDQVVKTLNAKEIVTNKIKLLTEVELASGVEVANASQTITISAVGPAEIGTATISKWLRVKGSDGIDYFIPLWT